MRAHYLSASKMSLAHICAFGFRGDTEQFPRPSGREAQIGKRVHSLAEEYLVEPMDPADPNATIYGGPELSNPLDDPDLEAAAQALFSAPLQDWLEKTNWTAWEIGMRYDAEADVATRGPRRGEPGYENHGPMVLPMTLDGVHFDGDLLTVTDLKSGRLVADTEQLRAQAVAASRLYGAKRARVGYVYARKTKCDEPKWTELSADDLDVEAGRISRLLRRLPMAEPNPGDHCWRCDARPACPAYGATRAANDAGDLEAAGFFG